MSKPLFIREVVSMYSNGQLIDHLGRSARGWSGVRNRDRKDGSQGPDPWPASQCGVRERLPLERARWNMLEIADPRHRRGL